MSTSEKWHHMCQTKLWQTTFRLQCHYPSPSHYNITGSLFHGSSQSWHDHGNKKALGWPSLTVGLPCVVAKASMTTILVTLVGGRHKSNNRAESRYRESILWWPHSSYHWMFVVSWLQEWYHHEIKPWDDLSVSPHMMAKTPMTTALVTL